MENVNPVEIIRKLVNHLYDNPDKVIIDIHTIWVNYRYHYQLYIERGY